MPPLYERIRLYSFYAILILVVSFAGISFILVWQEAEISESKHRNATFHVPTILHTTKIGKLLVRLEERLQANITDLEAHAAGEGHGERLSLPHKQKELYVIRTELNSIADLQADFGGARYARTLEKAAAEYDALSSSFEVDPLSPDVAGQLHGLREQLAGLRALILSLDQLERLHVISYGEVNQRLESQVWHRNVLVFPAVAVILLCALIGLRYLTSQTRDALARLEIADHALQSFNKDLEQRVEERTAELRMAQETLIRRERLAAVGQLTATVSHELRNPLGAIRSASDAIKRFAGDENPQMNRALALLERSQVRCDKIITELLNYTRVQDLNRSVTRVDDWLGDSLGEYELPPDITLRRELDSGVEIALDRDRLERAVRNVIENACHAMEGDAEEDAEAEESHQLIVATRATEQRLDLSIRDTGPGITAEEQAKIFEPLYSTKSFGVGLGLPMVKRIMEQHDGGIEIISELGRGTEVVLWLPRAAPEPGAAA